MTLIDQARDLSRDVKAGKWTREEAISALRAGYALTEEGAADVLDRWQELGEPSAEASL